MTKVRLLECCYTMFTITITDDLHMFFIADSHVSKVPSGTDANTSKIRHMFLADYAIKINSKSGIIEVLKNRLGGAAPEMVLSMVASVLGGTYLSYVEDGVSYIVPADEGTMLMLKMKGLITW